MSAVLLVLLFVLIAINGIFVAAEFALVRSRRSKLEQLAAKVPRRARRCSKQLDEIDEYLSACQLGITMASIGIGFLGEPAVAKLIEPIFGGLSHGVAVAISVAIAYALVTALHVVVGEQGPKLFAIARPEDSARRLAAPPELVPPADGSVHRRADLVGQRRSPPLRYPAGRARRGAADPRGPPDADLAVGGARQTRPGRGDDAGRCLPPARAGGARGDDADSGGGHGRCVGDRLRRDSTSASRRGTTGWSSWRTATRTAFGASSTLSGWCG